MFDNVQISHRVLAGVVGSTFTLALAVGVGIVPRAAGATPDHPPTTATAGTHQAGGEPGHHQAIAAPLVVPTQVLAPPTSTPAAPAPKAATSTKAASVATAHTATAVARTHTVSRPVAVKHPVNTSAAASVPKPATATTRPAPVTPPAAVAVARRTPTSDEIAQAISGMKAYVHTIFSPSAAQVAQLGDQVCTAFDQGQSLAQVQATELATVAKVPFTTVLPGAADYVTRTAVALYCPGHTAQLR